MCEFCGLHGAIHGDDKPLDSGFGFFSAAAIQSAVDMANKQNNQEKRKPVDGDAMSGAGKGIGG